MRKRILSMALVWLLSIAPAFADVFSGTTTACNPQAVTADAGGIIDEMYVMPGETVNAGDVIARLRTTKVFAAQSGTVARIQGREGKESQGTVLEIAPVSRYTVYCTSDGAYDSVASNLVHCGEQLYLFCTKNGTHQGRGRVYSIDGETYMVEATAGEFYVGETLYIYRDEDYSYKHLVGVGTVVTAATEAYESDGRIAAIHVSEGEYVEKGELLYEVLDGECADIVAPADGIVTACSAENGAKVSDGQSVADVAAYADICIAVPLDEGQAAKVLPGDSAALCYVCSGDEEWISGTVIEILRVSKDGSYTAYIAPQTAPDRLGMTVEVEIDIPEE